MGGLPGLEPAPTEMQISTYTSIEGDESRCLKRTPTVPIVVTVSPGTPLAKTLHPLWNISFVNPIPVAVMLVPVDEGLIVICRGIEPRKGMLALPGGFINLGESWQQAGAREVYEETGIALTTDDIKEFGVRSAEDGTLLIFGLASVRVLPTSPFLAHR